MPGNAVHSSTPCCVCGRCAYAVARAGTHHPGQAPAKPASAFKEKAVNIAALQYSHKCITVTCIHGYIAAGIAQAPKQIVMHPCIRRNAQHVRQSTCFMPSIACLMSSALSLLLCHASCMVNTQGGVLRRMCCTAFGTLHPPAEHRKLHVDDQDERKLVHSQTVPDISGMALCGICMSVRNTVLYRHAMVTVPPLEEQWYLCQCRRTSGSGLLCP